MMPGTYSCRTKASLSRSSTAVSEPSSCSRHSSTRSAASVKTAKLVPAPSYVAPSGYASPGQTCMVTTLSAGPRHRGSLGMSLPESEGTTYDLRPSYQMTGGYDVCRIPKEVRHTTPSGPGQDPGGVGGNVRRTVHRHL